jgi:hypothetical protein
MCRDYARQLNYSAPRAARYYLMEPCVSKGCQIPALPSRYLCTDFACYVTMIYQQVVHKWEYYASSPCLVTSTENYNNCSLPSFVIKTKSQNTSYLMAYFRLTGHKFEKTPCLMVISETKLSHDMDSLTLEQQKSIRSNNDVLLRQKIQYPSKHRTRIPMREKYVM